MIGPAQRPDGTDKDTLANCRPPEDGGTGCFTINAATEDNADAVFATAADLPPEASEFDHAGLSPLPGRSHRRSPSGRRGVEFGM